MTIASRPLIMTLRHILVAEATPSFADADLGGEAQRVEQRQQRRRVRPAQQQRHANAVGRHRGHHRALDEAPARAVDQRGRLDLRAGRGRIEIEEPGVPAGSRAPRLRRRPRVWLAVTALTTRSARPPARRARPRARTSCRAACSPQRAFLRGAELDVVRADPRHAARAQILGEDAADLAVADEADAQLRGKRTALIRLNRCT